MGWVELRGSIKINKWGYSVGKIEEKQRNDGKMVKMRRVKFIKCFASHSTQLTEPEPFFSPPPTSNFHSLLLLPAANQQQTNKKSLKVGNYPAQH